MRGVDEKFLRYATHIDAGSAQVAVFSDRDTRTVRRRETSSTHASRTRPDYKEIKLSIRQDTLPACAARATSHAT